MEGGAHQEVIGERETARVAPEATNLGEVALQKNTLP